MKNPPMVSREICLGFLFFEIVQHGVCVADFEGVGWAIVGEAGFDEEFFDFAVDDVHGIAPGAVAEAEVGFFDEHAHAFGEITVAVWEHVDFF